MELDLGIGQALVGVSARVGLSRVPGGTRLGEELIFVCRTLQKPTGALPRNSHAHAEMV
jgi:hypothetical protein